MELCLLYRGQTPAMAESNFLLRASQLDTYGVDPHPVKVVNCCLALILLPINNVLCKVVACVFEMDFILYKLVSYLSLVSFETILNFL